MSGRILSHRLVPLLRTGYLARHLHNAGARTGGLLRSDGGAALRGRAWPVGANSIHNVPAVRTISFARILPKLAMKLARVPAMFGGAMVAGLAYFQYQATRTPIPYTYSWVNEANVGVFVSQRRGITLLTC